MSTCLSSSLTTLQAPAPHALHVARAFLHAGLTATHEDETHKTGSSSLWTLRAVTQFNRRLQALRKEASSTATKKPLNRAQRAAMARLQQAQARFGLDRQPQAPPAVQESKEALPEPQALRPQGLAPRTKIEQAPPATALQQAPVAAFLIDECLAVSEDAAVMQLDPSSVCGSLMAAWRNLFQLRSTLHCGAALNKFLEQEGIFLTIHYGCQNHGIVAPDGEALFQYSAIKEKLDQRLAVVEDRQAPVWPMQLPCGIDAAASDDDDSEEEIDEDMWEEACAIHGTAVDGGIIMRPVDVALQRVYANYEGKKSQLEEDRQIWNITHRVQLRMRPEAFSIEYTPQTMLEDVALDSFSRDSLLLRWVDARMATERPPALGDQVGPLTKDQFLAQWRDIAFQAYRESWQGAHGIPQDLLDQPRLWRQQDLSRLFHAIQETQCTSAQELPRLLQVLLLTHAAARYAREQGHPLPEGVPFAALLSLRLVPAAEVAWEVRPDPQQRFVGLAEYPAWLQTPLRDAMNAWGIEGDSVLLLRHAIARDLAVLLLDLRKVELFLEYHMRASFGLTVPLGVIRQSAWDDLQLRRMVQVSHQSWRAASMEDDQCEAEIEVDQFTGSHYVMSRGCDLMSRISWRDVQEGVLRGGYCLQPPPSSACNPDASDDATVAESAAAEPKGLVLNPDVFDARAGTDDPKRLLLEDPDHPAQPSDPTAAHAWIAPGFSGDHDFETWMKGRVWPGTLSMDRVLQPAPRNSPGHTWLVESTAAFNFKRLLHERVAEIHEQTHANRLGYRNRPLSQAWQLMAEVPFRVIASLPGVGDLPRDTRHMIRAFIQRYGVRGTLPDEAVSTVVNGPPLTLTQAWTFCHQWSLAPAELCAFIQRQPRDFATIARTLCPLKSNVEVAETRYRSTGIAATWHMGIAAARDAMYATAAHASLAYGTLSVPEGHEWRQWPILESHIATTEAVAGVASTRLRVAPLLAAQCSGKNHGPVLLYDLPTGIASHAAAAAMLDDQRSSPVAGKAWRPVALMRPVMYRDFTDIPVNSPTISHTYQSALHRKTAFLRRPFFQQQLQGLLQHTHATEALDALFMGEEALFGANSLDHGLLGALRALPETKKAVRKLRVLNEKHITPGAVAQRWNRDQEMRASYAESMEQTELGMALNALPSEFNFASLSETVIQVAALFRRCAADWGLEMDTSDTPQVTRDCAQSLAPGLPNTRSLWHPPSPPQRSPFAAMVHQQCLPLRSLQKIKLPFSRFRDHACARQVFSLETLHASLDLLLQHWKRARDHCADHINGLSGRYSSRRHKIQAFETAEARNAWLAWAETALQAPCDEQVFDDEDLSQEEDLSQRLGQPPQVPGYIQGLTRPEVEAEVAWRKRFLDQRDLLAVEQALAFLKRMKRRLPRLSRALPWRAAAQMQVITGSPMPILALFAGLPLHQCRLQLTGMHGTGFELASIDEAAPHTPRFLAAIQQGGLVVLASSDDERSLLHCELGEGRVLRLRRGTFLALSRDGKQGDRREALYVGKLLVLGPRQQQQGASTTEWLTWSPADGSLRIVLDCGLSATYLPHAGGYLHMEYADASVTLLLGRGEWRVQNSAVLVWRMLTSTNASRCGLLLMGMAFAQTIASQASVNSTLLPFMQQLMFFVFGMTSGTKLAWSQLLPGVDVEGAKTSAIPDTLQWLPELLQGVVFRKGKPRLLEGPLSLLRNQPRSFVYGNALQHVIVFERRDVAVTASERPWCVSRFSYASGEAQRFDAPSAPKSDRSRTAQAVAAADAATLVGVPLAFEWAPRQSHWMTWLLHGSADRVKAMEEVDSTHGPAPRIPWDHVSLDTVMVTDPDWAAVSLGFAWLSNGNLSDALKDKWSATKTADLAERLLRKVWSRELAARKHQDKIAAATAAAASEGGLESKSSAGEEGPPGGVAANGRNGNQVVLGATALVRGRQIAEGIYELHHPDSLLDDPEPESQEPTQDQLQQSPTVPALKHAWTLSQALLAATAAPAHIGVASTHEFLLRIVDCADLRAPRDILYVPCDARAPILVNWPALQAIFEYECARVWLGTLLLRIAVQQPKCRLTAFVQAVVRLGLDIPALLSLHAAVFQHRVIQRRAFLQCIVTGEDGRPRFCRQAAEQHGTLAKDYDFIRHSAMADAGPWMRSSHRVLDFQMRKHKDAVLPEMHAAKVCEFGLIEEFGMKNSKPASSHARETLVTNRRDRATGQLQETAIRRKMHDGAWNLLKTMQDCTYTYETSPGPGKTPTASPFHVYKALAVYDKTTQTIVPVLAKLRVPPQARVDTNDHYKYRVSHAYVETLRALTALPACFFCSGNDRRFALFQWGGSFACASCADKKKLHDRKGCRTIDFCGILPAVREATSPLTSETAALRYIPQVLYSTAQFGTLRNTSCDVGIHVTLEPQQTLQFLFHSSQQAWRRILKGLPVVLDASEIMAINAAFMEAHPRLTDVQAQGGGFSLERPRAIVPFPQDVPPAFRGQNLTRRFVWMARHGSAAAPRAPRPRQSHTEHKEDTHPESPVPSKLHHRVATRPPKVPKTAHVRRSVPSVSPVSPVSPVLPASPEGSQPAFQDKFQLPAGAVTVAAPHETLVTPPLPQEAMLDPEQAAHETSRPRTEPHRKFMTEQDRGRLPPIEHAATRERLQDLPTDGRHRSLGSAFEEKPPKTWPVALELPLIPTATEAPQGVSEASSDAAFAHWRPVAVDDAEAKEGLLFAQGVQLPLSEEDCRAAATKEAQPRAPAAVSRDTLVSDFQGRPGQDAPKPRKSSPRLTLVRRQYAKAIANVMATFDSAATGPALPAAPAMMTLPGVLNEEEQRPGLRQRRQHSRLQPFARDQQPLLTSQDASSEEADL
jgi:hypothetical protein